MASAVTARDVQFTFDLNKNPALGGQRAFESGKHRLRYGDRFAHSGLLVS